MPLTLLFLLLASVLATSFISGLFGMAGGFILMGILLQLFPQATAFALHGAAQLSSNLWRAFLWRRYIYAPVLRGYLIGALAATGFFTWLQIQLDLKFVYLFLGIMPFATLGFRRIGHLDVTKTGISFVSGFSVVSVQLMAGVSGGFLDQFFVHSKLDRRQQLATKAAAQTLGHLTKILYFTLLLNNRADWAELTWLTTPPVILMAVLGNTLAAGVLQKMKQENFVRYSVYLLCAMGGWFLVKAGMLFYTGS